MLYCRTEELDFRLLGGGANLIIGDGVIPGVVISTERLRRTYRHVPAKYRGDSMLPEDQRAAETWFEEDLPRLMLPEHEEAPRLVAWAGASMPGLVHASKQLGWTGLEGLAGVPGSIGGGVAMNAGGSWGELWEVIERVRVINADGESVDLAAKDCRPGYRDGGLGEGVVSGVVLRLEVSTKREVEERVRDYLKHKSQAQPVTERSAGCMFRNPDKELSAGKGAGLLIDEAGLKGLQIGGAVVSEKHGNFVVNRGGATAADVLELIGRVEATVAERTGIELRREVKHWPGA